VTPSATSSLRPLLCAAVEAVILTLSVMASAVRLAADHSVEPRMLVARALVIAVILQLCLYYNDLYEDFAWRRRVELFVRVGQSFAVGVVVLTLTYYAVPLLDVGRRVLAVYLPLSFVAIVSWRFVFRWGAGHEALRQRVLILGTGQSARQIAREVARRPPLGFTVVGFVGEAEAEVGPANPEVIGTTGDLLPLVKRHGVDRIVMALDDRRAKMPMSDLLQCRVAGVAVEEATDFYERLAGNILVQNLRPSWLIFAPGFDRPRFVRNAKRAGDFVGSLVLLVLLAPLLALLGLLVKLTSPGPVVYRQERVGEKGRVFPLLKFRSMRAGAEATTGPVWAAEGHDPRVTRVGRLLRRFRLDELPQLVNVLNGEMSFVGPRPERPHFVDTLRRIVPYYDERHNVKPGITGWAQIKFGYGATIEDSERKLQFDLYYVKNMSFFLDLAIMLDTIKVMLPGRGEDGPAGRYLGGR
jgi:sugar transferase (PEP-CTERM system associated)